MLSEVFWSFFVSSMIGFLIATYKLCLKRKCKEVDVCCIKIIRDVALEENEMEFELTHTKQQQDTS